MSRACKLTAKKDAKQGFISADVIINASSSSPSKYCSIYLGWLACEFYFTHLFLTLDIVCLGKSFFIFFELSNKIFINENKITTTQGYSRTILVKLPSKCK